MKKIYVIGNPLVIEDSLPITLLPLLKREFPQFEFSEFEPSEDFPEEKEILIIDTIINAKEVSLVTDIDKIISENAVSLHDFDLGYNLKIMKKFKMIGGVKIIGIPPNMMQEQAINGIRKLIEKIS